MKSETVNPMPAAAVAPVMCGQATSSGSLAIPRRTARTLAPVIPISLPAVRPKNTPPATAAAPGSVRPLPDRWTPALASARRPEPRQSSPWVEHVLDPFRDRRGVLGDHWTSRGVLRRWVHRTGRRPAAGNVCRRQWPGGGQQPERHRRECGVKDRLFGSVVCKVADRAPCPIVVASGGQAPQGNRQAPEPGSTTSRPTGNPRNPDKP
jgi:hypothetical protein